MKNKICAFTLVELLVIIAIISILSCLILPALKVANNKANEILCSNNLKQTGTAFAMYTNDWNDYMPHHNPRSGKIWVHLLGVYLQKDGDIIDTIPWPMILVCPSNKYRYGNTNNPQNLNYVYNFYLDNIKFTSLSSPSSKLVFADGWLKGNTYYYTFEQVGTRDMEHWCCIWMLHSAYSACSYWADGHVGAVSSDQVENNKSTWVH